MGTWGMAWAAWNKTIALSVAVSVTSAAAGLALAGVEAGDVAIAAPLGWIAAASAFAILGAKVVFCDVDERTLRMFPARLWP